MHSVMMLLFFAQAPLIKYYGTILAKFWYFVNRNFKNQSFYTSSIFILFGLIPFLSKYFMLLCKGQICNNNLIVNYFIIQERCSNQSVMLGTGCIISIQR